MPIGRLVSKISQYTSLAVPAPGDLLAIVDIDDLATPPAGPAGSDKSITAANLAKPWGRWGAYQIGGLVTTGSEQVQCTIGPNSIPVPGTVNFPPVPNPSNSPVLIRGEMSINGSSGTTSALPKIRRGVTGTGAVLSTIGPATGFTINGAVTVALLVNYIDNSYDGTGYCLTLTVFGGAISNDSCLIEAQLLFQ